MWRTAKGRPGGYSPAKLAGLLKETVPGEKWVSLLDNNLEAVKKFSAEGYPIAATMSTGQQYNYLPIHHMVSLAHVDDRLTSVIDNNDPGHYRWMPTEEYARRFIDGSTGWYFVWLRKPQVMGSLAIYLAAAIIIVGGIKCRERQLKGLQS